MAGPHFVHRGEQQVGLAGHEGVLLGLAASSDRAARCNRPTAGSSRTARGCRCRRSSAGCRAALPRPWLPPVPGIVTMSWSMMNCLRPASCARAPATGAALGLVGAHLFHARLRSSRPAHSARRPRRAASGSTRGRRGRSVRAGRPAWSTISVSASIRWNLSLPSAKLGLDAARWLSTQATVSCIALTALSVAAFSACWSSACRRPSTRHAVARIIIDEAAERGLRRNRRSWSPAAS